MNHIVLFSELTTGKLKNILAGECKYKELLPLVQHVNRKIIFQNIASNEIEKHKAMFDFKSLGYHSPDDFILYESHTKQPNVFNIEVKPACTYHLQDDFTLLDPPDHKSALILGLYSDEFERIKSRALRFMESNNDEKKVKMYAVVNLQFTKTCFHTNKAVFQTLLVQHPDYLRHPVVFVQYYLNFFLIRVRLFYQKLFEHFLPHCKKTEEQLLSELFHISPSAFQKINTTAAIYQNNISVPVVAEPENIIYKNSSENLKHNFDSVSSLPFSPETIKLLRSVPEEDLITMLNLIGKFDWSRNANVLADVVFQLLHDDKDEGLPPLRASLVDIASLVSIFVNDKFGKRINKTTFNTYLQPKKTQKRPKSGSDKRIEINEIISFSE